MYLILHFNSSYTQLASWFLNGDTNGATLTGPPSKTDTSCEDKDANPRRLILLMTRFGD